MPHRTIHDIFKRGSKTYFYNTLFFPRHVKEDVFVLYSFVRKADDFVDSVPQRADEFLAFKADYARAMDGATTGDVVIDSFAGLSRRKGFPVEWTDAFLRSMEMDLHKRNYADMGEVDEYIYGSAEVIGLFMSRILGLREEAYPYARSLGKAMQYINFIRDINEDLALGRTYFPRSDFERWGLDDLTPGEAAAKPEDFSAFVRAQIARYDEWQAGAEAGFALIPRRLRVPIRNASEMYKWTANRIRRDPHLVHRKKVKPSVPRIVATMGRSALTG